MSEVVVRRLVRPGEFEEAVEVQRRAWRMEDYKEAAPAHLLRGLADNGGLVLGAFIGDRMAGVSYGWPAGTYFYSHATGVVEEYKYRGVGFKLKTVQRREILGMGFDLAKWTFDPLQSLNSRFNLNKLGAIAREYHINYYGEITDPINKGLGSDRVKAEWYLTSNRVLRAITSGLEARLDGSYCIALESSGSTPGEVKLDCRTATVLVEIPRSIDRIKLERPEYAIRWREATRKAYDKYINNDNYILVFNTKIGDKYYNILVYKELEEVLEI